MPRDYKCPHCGGTGRIGSLGKYVPAAKQVLDFLNEKTGRNYQAKGANLEFIVNRLREDATVEEMKAVIAIQCRAWKDDPNMQEFLRPKTLFNKTNYWTYAGKVGTYDREC